MAVRCCAVGPSVHHIALRCYCIAHHIGSTAETAPSGRAAAAAAPPLLPPPPPPPLPPPATAAPPLPLLLLCADAANGQICASARASACTGLTWPPMRTHRRACCSAQQRHSPALGSLWGAERFVVLKHALREYSLLGCSDGIGFVRTEWSERALWSSPISARCVRVNPDGPHAEHARHAAGMWLHSREPPACCLLLWLGCEFRSTPSPARLGSSAARSCSSRPAHSTRHTSCCAPHRTACHGCAHPHHRERTHPAAAARNAWVRSDVLSQQRAHACAPMHGLRMHGVRMHGVRCMACACTACAGCRRAHILEPNAGTAAPAGSQGTDLIGYSRGLRVLTGHRTEYSKKVLLETAMDSLGCARVQRGAQDTLAILRVLGYPG
jgi:hypothetical protein